MTKIAESFGAVYIYIVRFNRIILCEHRGKLIENKNEKLRKTRRENKSL